MIDFSFLLERSCKTRVYTKVLLFGRRCREIRDK